MQYTVRPMAGELDQSQILDFPSIIDLREMFGLEAIRANTGLWFDDYDLLAGYAIPDETRLMVETVPGLAVLFPHILAWADAHNQGDELEMACHEQYGFVRQHGSAGSI